MANRLRAVLFRTPSATGHSSPAKTLLPGSGGQPEAIALARPRTRPPMPGTPVGSERPPCERSPRASAAQPSRVFCPVPSCPCSYPARARGWASWNSMRHHVDAHLAGTLQGEVSLSWLRSQNRTRCPVCGLSVSQSHGVHPTCRQRRGLQLLTTLRPWTLTACSSLT
jgi:hypothetical protein